MSRAIASLLIALTLVFGAVSANAQQGRTFVSSQGADGGTCSLLAPCRSFAYAIPQTAPGGELVVLNTAGYGSATITQSMSIIAPAGSSARLTVASGVGITVNGAGIEVVLDGIGIVGAYGTTGILFQNGASLTIDRLDITTSGTGVQHNAGGGNLSMSHSTLRGIGGGDYNYCFIAQTASSSAKAYATIVDTHAENCGFGFIAHANSVVTIAHSSAAGASSTNSGICYADFVGFGNPSGSGNLALNDVVATNCYLGVATEPVAYGGSANVTVANSQIYGNNTSVFSGSGSLVTFGNNQIYGNQNVGGFSGTLTLQ